MSPMKSFSLTHTTRLSVALLVCFLVTVLADERPVPVEVGSWKKGGFEKNEGNPPTFLVKTGEGEDCFLIAKKEDETFALSCTNKNRLHVLRWIFRIHRKCVRHGVEIAPRGENGDFELVQFGRRTKNTGVVICDGIGVGWKKEDTRVTYYQKKLLRNQKDRCALSFLTGTTFDREGRRTASDREGTIKPDNGGSSRIPVPSSSSSVPRSAPHEPPTEEENSATPCSSSNSPPKSPRKSSPKSPPTEPSVHALDESLSFKSLAGSIK